MFDDFTAFYRENAVSAFLDYREINRSGSAGRSRDIRSAIVAATALFHLREHLPTAGKLSRARTESLCPAYRLLGDLVNAAKHKTVSRSTPHGTPLINQTTQIVEHVILTTYQDKDGPFQFFEKKVVVKLIDGSEQNVLEVLTTVVNFWEQHLHSIGVLSQARTFSYASETRARSREECEASSFGFEIVQGQRFSQTLILQRFNYESGEVEAIDLAGKHVTAKIYQPSYEVELSLLHNPTGTTFRKTIALSSGDSEAASRIKDEAGRQAFIDALPVAREAMRELVIEAQLSFPKG